MMLKLLLIAGGGGVGAVLRFLVAGAAVRIGGDGFPFGTLIVNLVGCLVIGVGAALLTGPWALRHGELYRAALLVGLLGGFTTFSTFGHETATMLHGGAWMRAAIYLGVSNAVGVALALGGYRATQLLVGA